MRKALCAASGPTSPRAEDSDNVARLHASEFSAVIAGREDVRERDKVPLACGQPTWS